MQIARMSTQWTDVAPLDRTAASKSPVPRFAYFRGRVVPYAEAKVGLLTHALHYGTAVFGGLRGYWNEDEGELLVFRPADHLRRFLESARLLRMDLGLGEGDLWDAVRGLLRREEARSDHYIRPLAFYADETIGVRLHGLTPEVAIVAFPFGRYVDNDENAHVCISSWQRVGDNAIPARGKIAGTYVNSALAKSDAQLAGFDEALVLNENGHVCEGSAENVFLVRNGVVATPPVSEDILEGITRRTVVQLLREDLGLEVVERPIDRTELYLAQEVFLTGTGAQVTVATRVDHRPVGPGRMGPIAARLRALFFDVVRGRVPRYRSWCAPVFAEAPAR
jgi:branched-chain amino acid aminotransferase